MCKYRQGLGIISLCRMTHLQAALELSDSLQHYIHTKLRLHTMKPEIAAPAIASLVYRAYSRKSLTTAGILTAFVTAIVHAIHPWSVCFALLAVFFLSGTAATKVSDAKCSDS